MKWTLFVWSVLASSTAVAGVKASSELVDRDDITHPAAFAVDGLLSTGWAEGVDGSGEGSWLEISLDRTTDIKSVSIWPGRIERGSRGLREYGRPHTVTVTLLGGDTEVSEEARILDIAETGPVRVDVAIAGRAKRIRVTIDEAYTGGIYSDTYITEVAVNFPQRGPHPSLTKLGEWMKSPAGEKSATEHTEKVAELKALIAGEEFGAREPMDELKSMAADGAAYLRDRVRRYVPDGYRVIALQPSVAALNTLLELEDANGIPALELASTRTLGKFSAVLRDRMSRMRALQDLKGGNKRNVLPFGEQGFCKGCLQSFGEPLDVVVDGYGGIWIADTGNHRVQRFNFDGISEREFKKGEPSISDKWLGEKRDWYAAGAEASAGDGAFTLPVSIDTVRGKNGDGVVVLDATGTVSFIDGDGKYVRSWSIGPKTALTPRVGGTGHIAVAKKSVVVAWGDQISVYNLNGELAEQFELPDGSPGGLVGFANGKFGAMYEGELILFSLDGFRHGDVINGTIPRGYEYYDAVLDELGKLWIITDTGYAIKYKKPGKVDFQVKLVDYSFDIPRADVYQDRVFVTNDDKILRFDALELAAKAEKE